MLCKFTRGRINPGCRVQDTPPQVPSDRERGSTDIAEPTMLKLDARPKDSTKLHRPHHGKSQSSRTRYRRASTEMVEDISGGRRTSSQSVSEKEQEEKEDDKQSATSKAETSDEESGSEGRRGSTSASSSDRSDSSDGGDGSTSSASNGGRGSPQLDESADEDSDEERAVTTDSSNDANPRLTKEQQAKFRKGLTERLSPRKPKQLVTPISIYSRSSKSQLVGGKSLPPTPPAEDTRPKAGASSSKKRKCL